MPRLRTRARNNIGRRTRNAQLVHDRRLKRTVVEHSTDKIKMTRKRISGPDLLVLECVEDDLSEVQIERLKKAEQEVSEFHKKLNSLNSRNLIPTVVNNISPTATPAIATINNQSVASTNQPLIIPLEQSKNAVHLVMTANNTRPVTTVSRNTAVRFVSPSVSRTPPPRILSQPRIGINPMVQNQKVPAKPNTVTSPALQIQVPSLQSCSKTSLPSVNSITKSKPPPLESMNKNNASLLKSKLKSNDVVDLTDDDNIQEKELTSDQKEVSICKVAEKTFPSLVVNVRVSLRAKEIPVATAQVERTQLDASVKRVLLLSATTFTEWLLQQGLLKCVQVCANHHSNSTGRSNTLKLGMYSDVNKFPYSGGYVWIGECCPSTFVSVLSGSIFEGAPHLPPVLLKLIYHWSCQTVMQNVLQWVKVDNTYVKCMYTNLRAVCTAAVHEHYKKLGGPKKIIEVGVISLGTTTKETQAKHVKVDVLGILEPETKKLRLKALESINDENKQQLMKKKNMKVMEALLQWVNKESIIVTDYTIDDAICLQMGFNNVVRNVPGVEVPPNHPTNQTISDYLKKTIPKMFHTTLALLSRQIIQQFLDELTWRETWGMIPSRAFDNIIQHISEQTRLDTGGPLMHRLARISANPFKNWQYNRWASNCKTASNSSLKLEKALPNSSFQSISSTPAGPSAPTITDSQTIEAAKIALEPYYYGTIIGNHSLTNERCVSLMKCTMCRENYRSITKLTEHLISHAFNKNVSDAARTKELCVLCLKICPRSNSQNLTTHRLQVHNDRQPSPTLCKICSIKHKDIPSIQNHMIRTHEELDMPYHCDICHYRTSILVNIHHHFSNAHGKGSKGYCPYCLKIFQFLTPEGKNLVKSQLRFVLHIHKHQLSVNKKCEKCLLHFTNRIILKEHQDNWHQSCKHLEDVERYTKGECTFMAAPLVDPLPNSTASYETGCKGTLRFNFDYSKERCCECDAPFSPEHFVGRMSCQHGKCRFTTCCNNAMKEHTALMHSTSLIHLRPPIIGVAPISSVPLYCDCGYVTYNGNHMARHLTCCFGGNRSCFIGKRSSRSLVIKEEEVDDPPVNNNTDTNNKRNTRLETEKCNYPSGSKRNQTKINSHFFPKNKIKNEDDEKIFQKRKRPRLMEENHHV